MINTNEIRKGMTILFEGHLQEVVDAQHVKPGKGPAFIRAKLRNLTDGALVDRKLQAAAAVERVVLDDRQLQFLYREGDTFHFMDAASYEQFALPPDRLGDAPRFLKEQMTITGRFYEDKLVSCEIPVSVVLKVVETPPGVRGDTASGGTKPATLETGHVVQVPLFIEPGTMVKVDTRTGDYVERG